MSPWRDKAKAPPVRNRGSGKGSRNGGTSCFGDALPLPLFRRHLASASPHEGRNVRSSRCPFGKAIWSIELRLPPILTTLQKQWTGTKMLRRQAFSEMLGMQDAFFALLFRSEGGDKRKQLPSSAMNHDLTLWAQAKQEYMTGNHATRPSKQWYGNNSPILNHQTSPWN